MRIQNKAVQGWVSRVLPSIWNVVCGLMSRNRRIYFGATSDPEARAIAHSKTGKGWSKMVLLFKTSSLQGAVDMESLLIKKARGSNFRLEPDNIGDGGEGLVAGMDEYWVYALVKE